MTPDARGRAEARARERELLATVGELAPDDPVRAAARDELVTMYLPLVRHLAGRYRDRGEPFDDLVQVGTIGLIAAIDRFDRSRGTELSTFATPTILGEIRRHFRDHAWAMHVPRGLQELNSRVSSTVEALTAQLHRSPTVREIADALGVGVDDVLAALEARHAYALDSLVTETDGMADDGTQWGQIEPAFVHIEERETLLPLLAALPPRQQEILRLRFVDGLSQTAIAESMGISQMHVSRLLARSLADLRVGMSAD